MTKPKPEVTPCAAFRAVIAAGRKSGLTTRAIAAKAGVSQSHVMHLLAGDRSEAIDRFVRVAEALGLEVIVR